MSHNTYASKRHQERVQAKVRRDWLSSNRVQLWLLAALAAVWLLAQSVEYHQIVQIGQLIK